MRSMFMTAETRMRQRQRRGNAAGLVACLLILGFAYALEWYGGMEPCPLCFVQRWVFMALGAVFLVGFLHGAAYWGRFIYAGLALAVAGAGIGVSGRHLYLQSLPPDQVPECGPGLEYMLDAFGLVETLSMLFSGAGECAEVDAILGVTLPAWSLAGYGLLAIWALLMTRTPR